MNSMRIGLSMIGLMLAFLYASAAHAGATAPASSPPAILNGVSIDQRLDESVPLDLTFADERGSTIALRQCMQPGRPAILALVYYRCPMLCNVTLNQLARSMNALSESAGKEFDVITVSFDPRETPALAAAKKRSYIDAYRRPTADAGWHFLTGSETSIRRLTEAVGFHYRWDEQNQLYAHAAGIIVLTPGGRISRYFLGVDYPSVELRQALRDAAGEAVGPPAEQIFLYCFHYDPATGRYGLVISRATQVLGIATLLLLAGFISIQSARERRRQRHSDGDDDGDGGAAGASEQGG